jgi:hypothetical protein
MMPPLQSSGPAQNAAQAAHSHLGRSEVFDVIGYEGDAECDRMCLLASALGHEIGREAGEFFEDSSEGFSHRTNPQFISNTFNFQHDVRSVVSEFCWNVDRL